LHQCTSGCESLSDNSNDGPFPVVPFDTAGCCLGGRRVSVTFLYSKRLAAARHCGTSISIGLIKLPHRDPTRARRPVALCPDPSLEYFCRRDEETGARNESYVSHPVFMTLEYHLSLRPFLLNELDSGSEGCGALKGARCHC
jgi:hypothetical protein